jgi:hypothetical protein
MNLAVAEAISAGQRLTPWIDLKPGSRSVLADHMANVP